MFDIKRIFDWAKDNGEVKAVDQILIKVMLLLIKNKITLTAATIEKMETRLALPDELTAAIVRAAAEVVGKPVPGFLLFKRGRGFEARMTACQATGDPYTEIRAELAEAVQGGHRLAGAGVSA